MSIHTVLLIVGVILCALAGCGVSGGKASLLALGCAFAFASFLPL